MRKCNILKCLDLFRRGPCVTLERSISRGRNGSAELSLHEVKQAEPYRWFVTKAAVLHGKKCPFIVNAEVTSAAQE